MRSSFPDLSFDLLLSGFRKENVVWAQRCFLVKKPNPSPKTYIKSKTKTLKLVTQKRRTIILLHTFYITNKTFFRLSFTLIRLREVVLFLGETSLSAT